MAVKTDRELRGIVDRKSLFQEEAVIAALHELEMRQTISDSQLALKENLVDAFVTAQHEKIKLEKEDLGLISKNIIGALCFFLSPLIGSIFFCINLWNVGRRNEIWIVVALAIIYTFIEFLLIFVSPLTILVTNGFSVYLVTDVLWKNLIKTTKLD